MTPLDLLDYFDPKDRKNAEIRLLQLRDVLWRFFEWRGVRDPEDCVHTVFLRGMEKISGGTPVYAKELGGFLYGIARMVLLEATRNDAKDQSAGEAPGPPAYRPGPVLNPVETKIYLEECLSGLDKDERELLTGYAVGAERPRGMSQQALRLRIHRIRKKLQKLRRK